MVEVRLFGSLRNYADNPAATAESMIKVSSLPGETIEQLVRRVGIDFDREVGNIFIDGTYTFGAGPRTVRDGSRIGVFPKIMALLYA